MKTAMEPSAPEKSAFAKDRLLDARISVARGPYVPGRAVPYAISELGRAVRGAASFFTGRNARHFPDDRLEAMYPRSVFGPGEVAAAYGISPDRASRIPRFPFTCGESFEHVRGEFHPDGHWRRKGAPLFERVDPEDFPIIIWPESRVSAVLFAGGGYDGSRSDVGLAKISSLLGMGPDVPAASPLATRWAFCIENRAGSAFVETPHENFSGCATATELLWYLGLKAKMWSSLSESGEYLPGETPSGRFNFFARADARNPSVAGNVLHVSGCLENLSETQIRPVGEAACAYGAEWKVLKLASR